MSKLQEALEFIEKIERDNPGKSAYEIVNHLRGYTKKAYTSRLWSTATGYHQEYIRDEFEGKLNINELVLSGEITDFGHFIGSLSDQIDQPGFQWSDFTSWTGDHTSWAGDIGSAIVAYRDPNDNIDVNSVEEALDRLARDSDYTADIAAYVVGEMINSRKQSSITQAIYQYNSKSYSENVRTFIKKRFGAVIEEDKLKNPAGLDSKMRSAISTYIQFSSAYESLKSLKDLAKLPLNLGSEDNSIPNSVDIFKGSQHFIKHIVKYGNLDGLLFKPYQIPGMSWLGTVNYEVRVPG
ncbi:MAG: hypothetical protein F6K63_13230 [Moorea sp. SIO1G6]|uniref:hypothetical protein n=1 Tax=Moorena sp. SIO1G6 TaxID=2607840 RepID=UPI0013C2449C|nr:hypothetical protein [Moorena sp. SIO1G6]NES83438.1 hypothetical protein [Moorena sp. SIO2B7]NET65287.1 hypothetical protein [Moorena sp. SIO1G6]